jgi:hypothetical protein
VGDVRQFRLELDKMARQLEGQALAFQREVTLALFEAVVFRTPVGNPSRWQRPRKGYVGGQARRNWRLAVGLPNPAVAPGTDPSGSAAIAAAAGVLGGLREPTSLWLSNPMPYIDRLENGWSRQAKEGIVGIAVREVARAYGLRPTIR